MADYKNLTEQDIEDGKKIAEIYKELEPQKKRDAKIFLAALMVAQMALEESKEKRTA